METLDFLALLNSVWTVVMSILFGGIVIYALWPANKTSFDAAANIPLTDDR